MENLASYLDHTLLKANATVPEFIAAAELAKQYQCASLCIPACHLQVVRPVLSGTSVALCTVVGFPFGYSDTESKLCEADYALKQGAKEIDMVMNISYFLSGNDELVSKEIEAMAKKCHACQAITKVIIETAYLTDEQKIKAALLVEKTGADFVKTSTGFAPSGACVADIALLHETVGKRLGIKASGGIQNKETALNLIKAGATRLGVSRTKAILGV